MARRVLITGATGFAGRHVADACAAAGDEVTGVSRTAGTDLRDEAAARAAVRAARPDAVIHLAALASVGRSWSEPAEALHDNIALGTAVLEAVRREAPGARVVVITSGEVYGRPERLPLDEDHPLRPQSPYGVAKAAVDLLGALYADAHGLDVVVARAFAHAGPGQADGFALSSFARQAAEGAAAIRTGRAGTRRDLTDVRDVARAYLALLDHGEAGRAYNVCSGTTWSARELVALVARVAGREIAHEEDPARVRAHEVPEIRGDASRLAAVAGSGSPDPDGADGGRRDRLVARAARRAAPGLIRAGEGTRTLSRPLTRRVLHQLSYPGAGAERYPA